MVTFLLFVMRYSIWDKQTIQRVVEYECTKRCMNECTDILFMPGGLGLCRGHVQWHALRPSGFLSWETVYLPPSSACIYSRLICISHLYWYLTFLTKHFIYTSAKMWPRVKIDLSSSCKLSFSFLILSISLLRFWRPKLFGSVLDEQNWFLRI